MLCIFAGYNQQCDVYQDVRFACMFDIDFFLSACTRMAGRQDDASGLFADDGSAGVSDLSSLFRADVSRTKRCLGNRQLL